ncbi:MAG: TetR/AcrR family transcriptional regulator, partial [Rhodobacteraceae bacterium]|nr:TetR/AcrR family transcriptional regulator [Paracoccaceae bacterium]
MLEMREKIAAGLERSFARNGFAKPSVDDLRVESGVSLRTLYKYCPSREDMILAALEHRHQRYLDLLFTDLPQDPEQALMTVIDRVGAWMAAEASHGCLFHAAVAAAPDAAALRELLSRHKQEVAKQLTQVSDLAERDGEAMVRLEG